jgi:hypothetical protein
MKVLSTRVNELTTSSGEKLYAISFTTRLLWFTITLWYRSDGWTFFPNKALRYCELSVATATARNFLHVNSAVVDVKPLDNVSV